MINFCVTNNPDQIRGEWTTRKRLDINGSAVWLCYDRGVELTECQHHWILFCGILWQGDVTDFIPEETTRQNGIFYCVVIDKVSGRVRAFNDWHDSFHLTYHVSRRNFIVTNQLTAYGPAFEINRKWFTKAHGTSLQYTVSAGGSEGWDLKPFGIRGSLTTSPIKEVQYLENDQSVVIQRVKESNGQHDSFHLTHRVQRTKHFTGEKPNHDKTWVRAEHDSESAMVRAKQVIKENCELIKQKYGDRLIHFCSTGIDSMVLQSHLDGVPMYGFVVNGDDSSDEKLMVRLYQEFSGVLHRFDPGSLQQMAEERCAGTGVQKAIDYKLGHMVFMHMRDHYNLGDRVIVQGNYGDPVFWHGTGHIIHHAIQRWNMTDPQAIWDKCMGIYGFGAPEGAGKNSKRHRIKLIQACIDEAFPDFASAVKEAIPYVQGQYMTDQLIIDPYSDLRLLALLPSSDLQTQEKSILECYIQQSMISDRLRPYLSPHITNDYSLWSSFVLHKSKLNTMVVDSILKNLQATGGHDNDKSKTI